MESPAKEAPLHYLREYSRGIERMAVEIHLPCCFALKSKRHESYLRYVHEEGDETTYGQLQLNGEDAVNPFTRFDSEPSLLHEGMVHIRCRYNRKYWVPRQRAGGWWIAADAHESEEDIDSANCTLIKPIISVTDSKANNDDATSGSAMTVRFLHAGHGKDTRMTFSMDRGTAACMRILGSDAKEGEEEEDGGDDFTVLNLSNSPRRLPRLVVFKGDNNQYLRGVTISGRNYLQFSARDPGDPTVAHEITYPGSNNTMHVRNIHHNMMWGFRSTDSEWVLANIAPAQAGPLNSLFLALDVKDYFALSSSYATTRYFRRRTSGSITNCLNGGAASRGITADARIRVEEPVLDREIYNIEYRLNNVRIYDSSAITMATTAAVNDTSKENIRTLTLAYEESELSTWDATLELKLGYNARIRAGFPKLGLGATVNISAEFFGAYNWAETMEKKVSHEVEYEVTVPPKTKVTVSLIATRSAIDVPFNYQQRDVMSTDGKAQVVSRTDGLYTGVNSYNFKFQTTEEKLKPRILATTPP